MRFKRIFVRASAFLLALLLMVGTPVGNYIHVREVTTAYASGAAMTAFQWIWAAILAACGVTTTDPVSIDSIADGVSRWVDSLTDEVHKAEYKLILESIQKASWGIEFNRAHQAVQMVKAFLMLKDGYGTDTGIDNIIVSGKISYDSSYCVRNGYDCTLAGFTPDMYFYSGEYFQSGSPSYDARSDYFIDLSDPDIRISASYNSNSSTSFYVFVYRISTKKELSSYNGFGYVEFRIDSSGSEYFYRYSTSQYLHFNSSNKDKLIASLPIPLYKTAAAARAYNESGVIGTPVNDYSAVRDDTVVPVNSKTEVQSRPIQQAGALRVPATMEEAYAQYIDFTGATTPDELVTALNPSWDITYGKDDTQTGDKDDTYPWVPDITGALNAIKDIITGIASPLSGIEKLIMEIPKILTDIYNGVISIPDTIAGFFSIDYAQVESAASSLKAAFMGKFEPLTAIVNVFQNSSASLNNEIPIMTMRVPDRLAPVVGGNEIIVFDLRGFEEYVTLFRNLIRCSIWLTFGYTVLGLFRIRFGID